MNNQDQPPQIEPISQKNLLVAFWVTFPNF